MIAGNSGVKLGEPRGTIDRIEPRDLSACSDKRLKLTYGDGTKEAYFLCILNLHN